MRRRLPITIFSLVLAALLAAAPGIATYAENVSDTPGDAPSAADVTAPEDTTEGAVDEGDSPEQGMGLEEPAEAADPDAVTGPDEVAADEAETVAADEAEEAPAIDAADIADAPEATDAEEPALEEESVAEPTITWSVHIQGIGTRRGTAQGADSLRPFMLGTTGESRRVEALSFQVKDYEGGITYRTLVQNKGWSQGWVSDGALSGTTGQHLRIEAVQIKLTGGIAAEYDIYYQAHVQGYGWLGWAKNGATAGSSGLSRRVEAFRIVLVRKGTDASKYQSSKLAYVSAATLTSQAHLSNVGWQGKVGAGSTCGTANNKAKIEAYRLYLSTSMSGGISYRAHVQGVGWQGWVSSGKVSGTTGQSKRVEAIQIKLTGQLAEYYDVYYRAFVPGIGWLGWAKNGESAGSTGCFLRIGAFQVKLVPKGSSISRGGIACMTSAYTLQQTSARGTRLVRAAYTTPSAPPGYCAAWVEIAYSNGGIGGIMGDARDLWASMPSVTSKNRLAPGMAVAVRHSRTDIYTAGYIYGHVGIYVGGGRVLHSYWGKVLNEPLDVFIEKYDPYGTVRWGYLS